MTSPGLSGMLDRPGGALHYEIIDVTGPCGPSVSNASHRGGSIQRAREWRAFIGARGMAAWGEMMTPLRLDRAHMPEAKYR